MSPLSAGIGRVLSQTLEPKQPYVFLRRTCRFLKELRCDLGTERIVEVPCFGPLEKSKDGRACGARRCRKRPGRVSLLVLSAGVPTSRDKLFPLPSQIQKFLQHYFRRATRLSGPKSCLHFGVNVQNRSSFRNNSSFKTSFAEQILR